VSGGAYLQTTALLSPGFLAFPPTLDGKTSAPETVTVTNIGRRALEITQVGVTGANAGDFSIVSDACQGTSVPPSGNCKVALTFAPGTALGLQSATLTIAENAIASPQTANLAGSGTIVMIAPAQLDFGNVKVGTISQEKVVVVTNTSTASLNIYVSLAGSDPEDFLLTGTCPQTLMPKEGCGLVVQFIPTKKGARQADLSITQPVAGANPGAVRLSGTGQ